ncbi:MAG: hypothetical protein K0S65_954, partial [Labilithrix sp.]|nr:hypothetical protein [Labilithrix sp.]
DVYLGGQCLSGDACPEGPRAALAHYDGSSWSFTVHDPAGIVTGLAGTRAGEQPRQLWIRTEDQFMRYPDAVTPVSGRILLAPVSASGGIEAPLFEKPLTWASGCNVFSASVVGPSAAWLSNGCLLYRWNGSQLVGTPFSRGNAPAGVLKGLWAESPDHVWIVGQSIPQGPDVVLNQAPAPPLPIAFPISGFAARRGEESP